MIWWLKAFMFRDIGVFKTKLSKRFDAYNREKTRVEMAIIELED